MADLGHMEVVIGADVDPLVKGVAKAELALKKIPGATNQASNALQNLSRVAQDAPYGFMGIQNNLNPLLESFQRLKTESGSTGKAIKALGSSLIGAGGLGLALSVVSAAILLYQKYMGEAGDVTKKSSAAISDALSESAASVSGNIARLEALVSIAKDVTKSDEARKEALGALNKEYDGFNGKLSLSNINTKESTNLINKQTQALVRQAQIRGLQDLITEETKKAAKDAIKDLGDNLTVLQRIQNAAVSIFGGGIAGQADAIVSGLKTRDKQLKESEKNIGSYKDLLTNLLGKDADAGTLFKEPKIKESLVKAVKDAKPEVKKEIGKVFGEVELAPVKTSIQIKIDREQAEKEVYDKLGKANIKPVIIPIEVTKDPFAEARESALAFQKVLTEEVVGLAIGAFELLGTSIGEALAGSENAVGGFFKGIANMLGQSLKDLGKYVIMSSTLIASLRDAMNAAFSGSPVLGIAAGIALIAIGTALQQAIPKFAMGTENFSGGMALVGERGPELVNLPKGSGVVPNHQLAGISGGGQQVMIPDVVLRGQDMVLIFNRANRANARAF